MKEFKKSISIKHYYRIIHLLSADRKSRIALVEDESSRECAIVDLATDQTVLPFDDYLYRIDDQTNLVFLRKKSNNKSTMTIYDSQEKKLLARKYVIVREIKENNIMVLQDPDTKKYFIFDKEGYLKKRDIFKTALDKTTYTSQKCPSGNYEGFIVTKGKKKGLYVIGKGLINSIRFDDIDVHGDKIIFSNDGKQQLNVDFIWSGEYDKVTFDPNDENIVYLHTFNTIFVYLLFYTNGHPRMVPIVKLYGESARLSNKWLISTNYYTGIYHFIVRKDGHETISEVDVTESLGFINSRLITDPNKTYDHIEYLNGLYVLKEGKYQSYMSASKTEVKRNKTRSIMLNRTLSVEIDENGESRIVDSYTKIAIRNIKSICKTDDGFIFNCEGSDIVYTENEEGPCFIECSKAKHLGCGIYVLEQTEMGTKNLYANGKYIADATGSEINIHIDDIPGSVNKDIYITIRKTSSEVLLLRYLKKENMIVNLSYLMIIGDIKLYDDFMVMKTGGFTTIQSYLTDEEIMKIEGNIDVEVAGHLGSSSKDGTIYRIGNKDFIYERRTGKLIEIPAKNKDIYIAAYEGEYGTVVVNTDHKNYFRAICLAIEDVGEEQFENTLQRNFASSKALQEKYPTLVLKPIDKKE